jgi:hypothetical protein
MLLKNLTEMFANSVQTDLTIAVSQHILTILTISYWARLLSGKQAKFSNVFYRLSRNLNENGDTNLNWVYFIRTILNECGFTYIWETEGVWGTAAP